MSKILKNIAILCVIVGTAFSVFGQTPNKLGLDNASSYLDLSNYYRQKKTRNLDSLAYYANKVLDINKSQAIPNEQSIDALSNLAFKATIQKDYEQARSLRDEARIASQKIDYGIGLASATRLSAFIHKGEKNYNMHIYELEKAYQITKQYDVPNHVLFDAALDLCIGYTEFQYNTDLVSKVLLEVIDLVEDPKISLQSKGIFYQNLGSVYELNRDNEKAISNYKKAISFFSQDENTFYLYYPLINLASVYRREGDFQNAISALERALSLNIKPAHASIYNSLGLTYLELKDYISSNIYFKKALTEYEAANDYKRQAECLKKLGEIQSLLNKDSESKTFYNLAIEKFEKSISVNQKYKINKYSIGISYSELADIYQRINNYKKSLEYYKTYVIYKDSVNNEQTLKVSDRFTFYKDATEKDEEIASLEVANKIQQIKSEKQQFLAIGLVISLGLILLLLGVLYNRYRLKQKALKIINEKNEENKLLMREIHHRVKNNLQIITSLLGFQIEKHGDKGALKNILQESQNKIKSMAIIHQNLYSGNQFAKVSVNTYVVELMEHIEKSFKRNRKSKLVKINLDIDPKQIQIGLAVPLGLILNEIVTNSYKYAFTEKNDQENAIDIKFYRIENSSKYYLTIKDNGVGLPQDFDINNLNSFGIQLVHGLVDQLQGEIEITNQKGTLYTIVVEEPIAA